MAATPRGVTQGRRVDESRLDIIAGALLTVGIYLISVVLLISVGGEGIITAPLMVPLLYIRTRMRPSKPFKFAGGLLAGLTTAEFGWGVVYRLSGDAEPKPWIWLIPVLGAVAVGVLFVRIRRRA